MNVESSDDSDQEFHTPRPTSSPLWNDKNTFFVDGLGAEREIFEISDDEEEEEEEEDGDFEMQRESEMYGGGFVVDEQLFVDRMHVWYIH